MRAIILAGGEGLRLRPLTDKVPKVLLPLNNKPICLYQIDWLKGCQIKEIVFAVGYLGDEIEEELGDGSKFGVKINYVKEDTPLDTAGALRNAFDSFYITENRFKDQYFVVLNGDILTDIDISGLLDFHLKKDSLVTILLVKSSNSSSYGVVSCSPDGRIKRFNEKLEIKGGALINAGIYVVRSEAIEYIPKGKRYSFEREFIPDLIEKDLPIYGYQTSGYWIDVGIPERYFQAQEDTLRIKL